MELIFNLIPIMLNPIFKAEGFCLSQLKMEKLFCILLCLLVILPFFHVDPTVATGTEDGSEEWGYVEVRPKVHLFWWLYRSPYRVEDPSKPWPTILWLQGGPGGSGVGIGNFLEMGPLDGSLKPRNSTWLRKADLLFVDSPVGTGYSYVDGDDDSLAVKTDEEAATDLTTLLKELFNGNESLQRSPIHVVAESYGGKFAVTLGLSALKAIQAGELKLKFGGVALGDSWISPEDFTASWGPVLKVVSRIDNSGLNESSRIAQQIKQQLAEGQFKEATSSWYDLEGVIGSSSNDVDFYNFMLDLRNDPVDPTTTAATKSKTMVQSYSRYVERTKPSSSIDLYTLMNGVIKDKLKIIPKNITWGGQEGMVFQAMIADFMKPRINEVDELLAKGVNVTVYNGQIDLICATMGAEAWVAKLKWEGLNDFLSLDRTPLYCRGDNSVTKGFVKSYKNLHFYWILGAGHFVPVDQPCVSLEMIGSITQSPSSN